MKRIFWNYSLLVLFLTFFVNVYAESSADPLPSWNDRPIKDKIIQFVTTVTDPSNPDFVEPNARIATIDNDGTLWVEQPLYTQSIFAIDRIKQIEAEHPNWNEEEPFKSALNNQLNNLSRSDFEKILAVTHSNISVEDYHKIANAWLSTATDKRFKRHYTDLVYVPMLELIRYLHENNFKVFIVSGGGQDFMRAFSETIYKIPRDRIIGTASKTHYISQNQQPQLIKMPQTLFVDNYEGKAQAIDLFIGRKPIFAVGNSDGDKEMLEWTQSGPGKRMMLLVHHDDAKREYAYDTQSRVGTFSKALMDEANSRGWDVISMKKDWNTIFSFDTPYESSELGNSKEPATLE